MNNKSIPLAIVTFLLLYLPWISAAESEHFRHTIVFKGSGIPSKAEELIKQAGGELIKTFPKIGVGIAISTDSSFSDLLKSEPLIHSIGVEGVHSLPQTQAVELDGLSVSGPQPGDAFYYLFQWSIRRVKADQAWPITSGSHETVVAVIDTGIAWNHSDLAANVVHSACYSSTDSCTPYPDASFADGGWHGTAVAGIVAAAFGEGLMVGVGPELALASYKVFEQIIPCGYCAYDGSIWEAMLDAAAKGYDVINLSLGSYATKSESKENVANWTAWNRLANYVTKQGVTIVASSGNDGLDTNGSIYHVPSDLPAVISVGATGIRPEPYFPQENSYDVRPFYSNYGAAVTLAAPGGDLGPAGIPYPFPAALYLVFSNFVSMEGTPWNELGPLVLPYVKDCEKHESCPEGYIGAFGTSFAAPHVAGAAAMMIDRNPSLTPYQVRATLKRTAENLGDRFEFGHGMLDIAAAVGE